MTLVKARKNASEIELTFENGFSKTFDAVVFAIPFSTLSDVELDASLGLPTWKLFAINKLRYGTNAKMMVGFDRRPWLAQGSNGGSYSDLGHHQTTWGDKPNKGHGSARDIDGLLGRQPGCRPRPQKRSDGGGVLPQ
jgi:monoamine oxidase